MHRIVVRIAVALGALGTISALTAQTQPRRTAPAGAVPVDNSQTARARQAVERVLPLLQSSARIWFQNRKCASCHHQGLGMAAIALARETRIQDR